MDKNQFSKSQYKGDVEQMNSTLQSMRTDANNPTDISMSEMVHKRYGISMDAFYEDLGINPSRDTISNIVTLPDNSVRWLIPEIIRSALRLGLRKAPIWADLIAAEETLANPTATIPHLNMSDAIPRYVGEAETIPEGNVSYGQKTLKIKKMGRGIKIPYEVMQYVSINIISVFLQDFGVKLNHGIDGLLIDTLINGEQANGSESAPVVGIQVPGTLAYRDLLRVWVRMGRIGKIPQAILGGEDAALDALDLPEFKTNAFGGNAAAGVPTSNQIQLKSAIPSSSAYYIHGAMPADQHMVIDRTSSIIKYNSQPLLVEQDKVISNQTIETYASLTTGFGILFRDGRVIVDQSLDFSTNGFPSYMDVDAQEAVTIE